MKICTKITALLLVTLSILYRRLHESNFAKIRILDEEYLSKSDLFLNECHRIELTSKDIQSFNEKGFLKVENALNIEFVKEIKELMIKENEFFGRFLYEALLGTYPSTADHWVKHDLLVKLWFEENIADIIAQLQQDPHRNRTNDSSRNRTESETRQNRVRFLTDVAIAFPKLAKPKVLLGWHTDSTTFDVIDDETVGTSVWIPLANVESRHGGSVYFAPRNKITKKCLPKVTYSPSDECDSEFDKIAEVEDFALGDVMFFSRNTLHRTQPFKASSPLKERHAIVGRYFDGERAIYSDPFAQESYTIRQAKTYCKHNFKEGDKIENTACWPQVFPERIESENEALVKGKVPFGSQYTFVNLESVFVLIRAAFGGKIE